MPRPASIANAPEPLDRDEAMEKIAQSRGMLGVVAERMGVSLESLVRLARVDREIAELVRSTRDAHHREIAEAVEVKSVLAIQALGALLSTAVEKIKANQERVVPRYYTDSDGKRVTYQAREGWELNDAEKMALRMFAEKSALGRKHFGTRVDVSVQGTVDHRHAHVHATPQTAAQLIAQKFGGNVLPSPKPVTTSVRTDVEEEDARE